MSDIVKRLQSANVWINEGICCGQIDASGACMAPACIFGEALKVASEAADEITHLRAEVERLKVALGSVMIGGNSLAQIIGADHPPYGTTYSEALAYYGSGVKYEAWCCWNAIMLARAALKTHMSDLRERVIAAIKAKGPHAKASTIADAVMPLCMEEAAREAECVVAYGESQAVMRENIAAAIRALGNTHE